MEARTMSRRRYPRTAKLRRASLAFLLIRTLRGNRALVASSNRIAPNGRAVINVPEIVLNLPGGDERIEEFLNYLRDLGKAGISYMTYGFEATAIGGAARRLCLVGILHPTAIYQVPTSMEAGTERRIRSRFRMAASSRARKSGTTSPTSSRRLSRLPRSQVCASGSTLMTHRS